MRRTIHLTEQAVVRWDGHRVQTTRLPLDARRESKASTNEYPARVADSDSAAEDASPQGRCVCGEKVAIADVHEITLPNGRPGWQGYCPVCGAPLFAIRRGSRARS